MSYEWTCITRTCILKRYIFFSLEAIPPSQRMGQPHGSFFSTCFFCHQYPYLHSFMYERLQFRSCCIMSPPISSSSAILDCSIWWPLRLSKLFTCSFHPLFSSHDCTFPTWSLVFLAVIDITQASFSWPRPWSSARHLRDDAEKFFKSFNTTLQVLYSTLSNMMC
jgi:hypothetical protein